MDARTSAKSARDEYVSSSYSMTVHVLLDGVWQDEEKFCGVTEGRDLNFGATLSKTSLEFTAAGRCTKTNSTSTTWSDRGKRGTKQWRARSASNVWQSRFGGNLRSGGPQPPPPRNSGRSMRRHPRFYNATVTSAKGREMEPRDKSETNITPPRATCNDDEWIECSRGGPGKSQKISKTRHGLQKQRNSKAIDITVSF